jgi:hypothetical protein
MSVGDELEKPTVTGVFRIFTIMLHSCDKQEKIGWTRYQQMKVITPVETRLKVGFGDLFHPRAKRWHGNCFI